MYILNNPYQILGLNYDFPSWSVHLDKKKLWPLLQLLYDIADAVVVDNVHLESLNGKLAHYHLLAGDYIDCDSLHFIFLLARSLWQV